MADSRLDDLGRRIEACMAKHGFTIDDMPATKHQRMKRLVILKMRVEDSELLSAMKEAGRLINNLINEAERRG